MRALFGNTHEDGRRAGGGPSFLRGLLSCRGSDVADRRDLSRVVFELELLAYSIYVAAIDDHFRVAIVNYIPSVIFLAMAFALRYRRRHESPVLIGLLGLIVTGIAAVIQRSGLSLHPTLFNHNATYHLVQAIGLFLIFRAAIFLAREPFLVA